MPIEGLKELKVKLNNLTDENAIQFMNDVGALVEKRARDLCPKKEGTLARSIAFTPAIKVGTDIVTTVGTNVSYAPYVHEGTGIYAKNGKGRNGYWIYVKFGGDSNYIRESESKTYATEDEAKRAVAIMYKYHPDWQIFYTNGQAPNPFLTNALHEVEPLISEQYWDNIKEALK